MALQFIVRCKARGEEISKVHIFSDSQSPVGQLTLGWKANSHKTTVQEVIREKQKLEEKKVTVEVSWSPGHADIKGNEYADKLAKEAAQEAMDSEQLPAVILLGDVKSSAKESRKKKWQDVWEKSDTGRNLYRFREKVDHKVKHTYELAFGERIISQLRTGYVRLNEYLHKCNLKDTSDFFHLFGNGTGTSSIGKNSVVFSFQLGKKLCFPLKLGKFHHQSEIGYKTLAPKTNTIKLLQIVNLCYQKFAKEKKLPLSI